VLSEANGLFGAGKHVEVIALLSPLDNAENADNDLYSTMLTWLGASFYHTGNYTQAEKCYLKSKDIHEKTGNKENSGYARLLNSLGALYYAMGDHAKAQNFYREAKDIWGKTPAR
jgi:tetratricopeptide (TPR) repeat protein